VGCAVLYDGQGRFYGSTSATVDYVVRQSGDTVDNLRTFTGFLQAAKSAGVGPVSLPDDVKGRIDAVVRKVGSASDVLAARTASNSAKIRDALDTMYVAAKKYRNLLNFSLLKRIKSKSILNHVAEGRFWLFSQRRC
jgi:hypothetical protein